MPLRQATTTALEQQRDQGIGPRVAYFVEHPTATGVYVPAVGAKATDGDAFVKDNGDGVFILDDDVAAETRVIYVVDTNLVML